MSSKCPKSSLSSPRQRSKGQIQTKSRHRKTPTPRKRISLTQKNSVNAFLVEPQLLAFNDDKKQKDHMPCSSTVAEQKQSRSRSRKNSKTNQVIQKPTVKLKDDLQPVTEKTPRREYTVKEETLKKEIIQGFVVDEWFDLGPSQHKDGHSPTSPEHKASHVVDIKQSPTSFTECVVPRRKGNRSRHPSLDSPVDVVSDNQDVCKHSAIKDNFVSLHQSNDTSFTDRHTASTHEYRRQVFTHSQEQTGLDPPVSPPSFWPQKTSLTTGSYNFPLTPFLQSTQHTRGHHEHWDKGFHTSNANPISLLPNVFPLGIGSRFGEAGLSQNTGQGSARKSHSTSAATPSVMLTSNETAAAASERYSNSFHASNINDEFTGETLISKIQYPGVIYPEHLFHQNAVPAQGMVFLQPHPYFIQPMPFPSVFPNIGYAQIHNCEMKPVANGLLKTEHEFGSASASLSRSRGTESIDELPQRDKVVPVVVPQSLRYAPKAAAGDTDFIDPTKIKFGVDDEGTDDEMVKLKENIDDTSDEEWQPKNWSGRQKNMEKMTHKTSAIQRDVQQSETRGRLVNRAAGSKREHATCATCGKHFLNECHLRRHEISHSEVRPHSCYLCNKRFKQKAHLMGHMSVHERPQVPTESPAAKKQRDKVKCPGRPRKSYTEKDLSCKECGKCFKTIYRLKRHEQSHTDIRPFSCKICGKGFKQTGHRNEHEANHEKGKKRFLCNMCGVIFRCRSSFNNHIKSHSAEKLRLLQNKESSDFLQTGYDCPYCPEKFATAQALNNHLETHVEVKHRRHVQPYSCDVCKRAFTYRHNLLKHKLIHKAPEQFAQYYKEKIEAHVASGKPSFKCFVCSKVFIRKETLAKHFKIHSGTKPFKCAICVREFTQNVHLKVHMRKHTGSRPFQCKECGKGFIDSTSLAKHIEYEACNAENVLYRCKVCDKRHYYMGSIKQHVRKEHGVVDATKMEAFILKFERVGKRKSSRDGEKFMCKICCWNFTEKCNLVRHVKRKHTELVELVKSEHRDQSLRMPVNASESTNNVPAITESLTYKSVEVIDNEVDEDKESRRLLIDDCMTGPHTQNCTPEFTEPIRQKSKHRRMSSKMNSEDFHSCLDSSVEESNSSYSASIDNEEKGDMYKVALLEGFEHEAGYGSCYQDVNKRECGDESGHAMSDVGKHDQANSYVEKNGQANSDVEKDGQATSDVEKDDQANSDVENVSFESESKTSIEKNRDLSSDMNFLYHIGLIVSSKPMKLKSISKTCMRLKSHRKAKTTDMSPLKEIELLSHTPLTKLERLGGGDIKRNLFLLEPRQDEFLFFSEKTDRISGVDMKEKIDAQFTEEKNKPSLPLSEESSDLIQSNHLDTGRFEIAKCTTKVTGNKTADEFRAVELALSHRRTPLYPGRHDGTPSRSAFLRVVPRSSIASKSNDIDILTLSDNINSSIEMSTRTNESPTKPQVMMTSFPLSNVVSSGNSSKYPSPDKHLADTNSVRCSKENSKSAVQEICDVSSSHSEGGLVLNTNKVSNGDKIDKVNTVPNKCYNGFSCERAAAQEELTVYGSFRDTSDGTKQNISRPEECSPKECSQNEYGPNDCSPNKCIPKECGPYEASSNETNANIENTCTSQNSKWSQEFTHQSLNSIDNITLDLYPCQSESPGSRLCEESVELIRTPVGHDEYESCPTESHLKCLGLLACRDSREIESRSYPFKTLYATFKPWLESLVCSSRGRRAKFKATVVSRGDPSSNDDEQEKPSRLRKLTYDTVSPSGCQLIKLGQTVKHESRVLNHKRKAQEMCAVAGAHPGGTTDPNQINLETNNPHLMASGGLSASAALVKAIASSGNNIWTPRRQKFSEVVSHDEGSAREVTRGARDSSPEVSTRTRLLNVTKSVTLSSSSMSFLPVPAVFSASPTTATHSVITSAGSKTSTPPTTPDSTTKSRHQFPCLVCAKVFNARHQLKRHELTHTDKRPYCCDECGRAFRQKVHLTDHQKRHQGHRPFLCAGCGKRFVLKNEMNQHIKNHCKGTAVVSKTLTTGSPKPIFTISLQELTPLLTGRSTQHPDDVITFTQVAEGIHGRQGGIVYTCQGVAETVGLGNQDYVTSSSNVQLEVKDEPQNMPVSSFTFKSEPILDGGEILPAKNGQNGEIG